MFGTAPTYDEEPYKIPVQNRRKIAWGQDRTQYSQWGLEQNFA